MAAFANRPLSRAKGHSVSSSSTRLSNPKGPRSVTAATPGRSDLPTVFEMSETVLLLITGAVVGAPILPGFTLCVPGLILLGVVVLAPLVALVALATLAGAILAIPYLLVRSIRYVYIHLLRGELESAGTLIGEARVTAAGDHPHLLAGDDHGARGVR